MNVYFSRNFVYVNDVSIKDGKENYKIVVEYIENYYVNNEIDIVFC